MKNPEVRLLRLQENEVETLGRLFVFDGLYKVFECVTLELPDRDNATSVSRINAGIYICKKRWSEKYKDHYILLDVEGRSYILIHSGNYHTHTHGCLLFGESFADINADGELDITNSKKTIEHFMSIMPEQFELKIIDV